MRASRVVLNIVVLAAAILLSGCYVATQNLPAGSGPPVDDRLIGAWRALDNDGKPTSEATYLHFVKTGDTSLTLVLVDNDALTTYDMKSIKVGSRVVFAIKPLTSSKPVEVEEKNYILGFYDVKGDDLFFNLLDAKKFKVLVDTHKIKGMSGPKDYDKVTLSASPQELAAFLANTDVKALIGDDKPARAHRLASK